VLARLHPDSSGSRGGEEIRLFMAHGRARGPEARVLRAAAAAAIEQEAPGPWRRTACCTYYVQYVQYVYGVTTREHGERPKDERRCQAP
jgi:hypothetical protein